MAIKPDLERVGARLFETIILLSGARGRSTPRSLRMRWQNLSGKERTRWCAIAGEALRVAQMPPSLAGPAAPVGAMVQVGPALFLSPQRARKLAKEILAAADTAEEQAEPHDYDRLMETVAGGDDG